MTRLLLALFILLVRSISVAAAQEHQPEATPMAMPMNCPPADSTGMQDHVKAEVLHAQTAYNAHIRREPFITKPKTLNSIMVVPKGTMVAVHGRKGDRSWYHVVAPDGQCGWMHHTVLHLSEHELAQLPINEVVQEAMEQPTPTATPLALATVTITLQVCTDLNGSGTEACDEREGVRNVPVHVADLSSFEQVGPRGLTDERGVLRLTVQTIPDTELFISAPSLPWSKTVMVRDGEAAQVAPIVLEQPAILPWLLP